MARPPEVPGSTSGVRYTKGAAKAPAYPACPKYALALAWYVVEYLTLFAIVLLHEFGHALACRSVGGKAERIYLWPLGGAAFVNPPPRPGPFLWSIVAGPLVNLLLVPFILGVYLFAIAAGLGQRFPDAQGFLFTLFVLNLSLLVFNMLPVFPLDGGQTLQALLWFFIGRARSLMVVTVLGLPVALGFGVLMLASGNYLLAAIGGFAALASLAGIARARVLLRILNAPPRAGFRCPGCGSAPPAGEFWVCNRCMQRFDTFGHQASCPRCGNHPDKTMCAQCLQSYPMTEWPVGGAATAVVRDRPRLTGPPPPRPAPPQPTTPVPFRQRLLWAAFLGGAVLAVGLLVGGRDNLTPVLVLALGGAILGATQAEALSRGRKARAALNRLRGTWRLAELNGKDLTAPGMTDIRLTVEGHLFTERTDGKMTARGSFWIDATRQPGLINLVPREGPATGSTFLGLYEVEDDVWRVCVGPPHGPRPTHLAFEPERQQLLVYRRR